MELISKADAVQVIWESVTRGSATKKIDERPTIEERKEGHWEHIDGTGWWTGWYRCSECGEKEKMKGSFQPYCRWCGAKMKGE